MKCECTCGCGREEGQIKCETKFSVPVQVVCFEFTNYPGSFNDGINKMIGKRMLYWTQVDHKISAFVDKGVLWHKHTVVVQGAWRKDIKEQLDGEK